MNPTAPNNNNPFDRNNPTTPPPSGPQPGISATIIDPNDPLVNQPNQLPPVPDNEGIQPGQYVVAGQEPAAPLPFENPQPVPPPPPAPVAPALFPAAGPAPMPTSNLAQPIEQQPSVPFPPASPLSGANVPGSANQQPDPTPYAPPLPTPGQQGNDSGGSMIKKLRLAAIGLGIVVLLAAIGALLWFFLLSKNNSAPAKVEPTEGVPVTDPSPLPKRTGNGFDTLPSLKQSTSSALQSTPSAR